MDSTDTEGSWAEWIQSNAVLIGLTTFAIGITVYLINKKPRNPEPPSFHKMTLLNKEEITSSVRLFTFSGKGVDVPTGSHVLLRFRHAVSGRNVSRKYTPISYSKAADGEVTLAILMKIYDQAKMGHHLEGMSVGDTIEMKGPTGRLRYERGSWTIQGISKIPERRVRCKNMVFVVGGTGITPAYQVIKRALQDSTDQTKIWLVTCNSTPRDILLRNELEEMESSSNGQLHVMFNVSSCADEDEWTGPIGRITADRLSATIPPATSDTVLAYCGPPAFEKSVAEMVQDLGYGHDVQLIRW